MQCNCIPNRKIHYVCAGPEKFFSVVSAKLVLSLSKHPCTKKTVKN